MSGAASNTVRVPRGLGLFAWPTPDGCVNQGRLTP
jgi:hypothetical protein